MVDTVLTVLATFIVICSLIIVVALTITMLTFMVGFVLDAIIDIKEKIEEMFW